MTRRTSSWKRSGLMRNVPDLFLWWRCGPWQNLFPPYGLAKVEWHQGELFPRVGFIVTNLSYPPKGIVRFYNGRGTAEQWIKEGKYALNWTRLSCHKFVANQVRLWLFRP